jgi:Fe-S-cluster containining protein
MKRRNFIFGLIGAGFSWLVASIGVTEERECIRSCDECRRDYECCRKFLIYVTKWGEILLKKRAKELGVKVEFKTIEGNRYFKGDPCPFWNLKGKNLCAIYEKRPKTCKVFYCCDWCPDAIPVPASERGGC